MGERDTADLQRHPAVHPISGLRGQVGAQLGQFVRLPTTDFPGAERVPQARMAVVEVQHGPQHMRGRRLAQPKRRADLQGEELGQLRRAQPAERHGFLHQMDTEHVLGDRVMAREFDQPLSHPHLPGMHLRHAFEHLAEGLPRQFPCHVLHTLIMGGSTDDLPHMFESVDGLPRELAPRPGHSRGSHAEPLR